MVGMVCVTIGSGLPIYLDSSLLCARSLYFRASLQGGFSESTDGAFNIRWEGNAMICEAFLFWLGEEKFTRKLCVSYAVQFLACCAYFQVTEEYWELVQREVTLPAAYSQTTEEMKTVLVRQTVPFAVMKKIVERVPSKLERLVFMFAWFNEKTATTPSDQQDLQTCTDFYQMHDLAIATFSAQPKHSGLPTSRSSLLGSPTAQTPVPPVRQVLSILAPFPLASNCLETVWLLQLLASGDFQEAFVVCHSP